MFYNKSSNKDLTDYGSTNITIVESTKNPDNECHVEDIARNIKMDELHLKENCSDKESLNGLRGLFSLHVMMYHACGYMPFPASTKVILDLYGQIPMPMFFLLSGFSLVLRHADKSRAKNVFCMTDIQSCSLNKIDSKEEKQEVFDSWSFYRNRIIRILPLHLLGNSLAVIVWSFGIYTTDAKTGIIGTIMSLFGVSTWVLPYQNFGLNIPSWTISTLAFWYWCFPIAVPKLQKWSDEQLIGAIAECYWVQIACGMLVVMGFGGFVGNYHSIYWLSTANPILRFPVFLMGMLGGLYVLRYRTKEQFTDCYAKQNLFYTVLPYWKTKDKCCINRANTCVSEADQIDEQYTWKKRADFNSFMQVTFLGMLVIGGNMLRIYNLQNNLLAVVLHGAPQFLLVHSQLSMIIGLCLDKGCSVTSKILRMKIFQFLGKISLSLYLIHAPIMGFFALAINGQQLNCECIDEAVRLTDGKFWNCCIRLPVWSPLVLLVVSPALAFFITKYFEEPVTKILRT